MRRADFDAFAGIDTPWDRTDLPPGRRFAMAVEATKRRFYDNGAVQGLRAAWCGGLKRCTPRFDRYRTWLADSVPHVSFAPVPAGVMPTWKDFNLLLDARLARRRSEIAASLQAQSVETRAGWVVQALGRAVVGTVL